VEKEMTKYKLQPKKLRQMDTDALLEVYRQVVIEHKRLEAMRATDSLGRLKSGGGGLDLANARKLKETRKNKARILTILSERGVRL